MSGCTRRPPQIPAITCLTVLLISSAGCDTDISEDEPVTSLPASGSRQMAPAVTAPRDPRDAFVGRWTGTYADIADDLIVRKSPESGRVVVTLHATFANPAAVIGEVIDANTIQIAHQPISGVPGTARLTLRGTHLTMRQSGMGLTFEGHYEKTEE